MKKLALIFSLVCTGLIVFQLIPDRRDVLSPSITAMPSETSLGRAVAAPNPNAIRATLSQQFATAITEDSVPRGNPLLAENAALPEPVPEPVFTEFLEWTEKFIGADAHGRTALEVQGIALAGERREAMAEMIKHDPERALQLAVSFGLRGKLPASITGFLEQRVSGCGTIDTWAAAHEDDDHSSCAIHQFMTLDEREFEVFTYGGRVGHSRENVSVHGIAVGKLLAIHEDPVRVLEPDEAAQIKAVNKLCAVDDFPTDSFGEETIVEIAGKMVSLCKVEHLHDFNGQLIEAENKFTLASQWTEGEKKILFIRVRYPDDSTTPVGLGTLTNMLNNSRPFYRNTSYGRTGLATFTDGTLATSTVLLMPQNKNTYTSLTTILNHAKKAAHDAGYNTNNFNFHVVCSVKTPVTSVNAVARVGSSGVLMNGYFSSTSGLLNHELGHNYGVYHSNFKTLNDYGDIFDVMGGDAGGWDLTRQHFNTEHKARLDWIKSSERTTVTASGLYTLYPHDITNSLGKGLLGLKVPINSSKNYWVEYRRQYGDNTWLLNGAGLRTGWNNLDSRGTYLIDTTPNSDSNANRERRDSPVVIGRTFSDSSAGIHVTPVGLGGTSPQSLIVRVNLGTFSGNRPPTLSLSGRTSAMVGEAITLTANANDLDGDELAYYWDFSNSQFDSQNDPTIIRSWASAGTYTVRCSVTDMKGGGATNTTTITITTTPVPPSITSQPQSQTNTIGANVTFNVSATGTAPLSYQWRFNTTNLVGATHSAYTRNNIQLNDAGNYSVIVSNAAAAVTSANALLTLASSPGTNYPPLLASIENRTVYSGSTLTITNAAFDPNPADTLTFSLDPGAPPTAFVHPVSGIFTWTPSDADANSSHPITVRVTDNGSPPLSGASSFSVTVLPANKPPLLNPIANWTLYAGGSVTFTNFAFDADSNDTLTFSLDPGAPPGASLDPASGVFVWNTSDSDPSSTNAITVRVTDDGEPPLSGTANFTIIVHEKPKLENVSASAITVILNWSAIPDKIYRVQFKNSMSDAVWQTLGSDVVASGSTASTSDDTAGSVPQRFYRILVVTDGN
ncbi:MAG: immunoglobulin domain-containing protein [Verrucomicrobia bacterium]|nr:immunoglobulin domain-containing protein [Verrucomicrobiota bacterium]